MIALLCLVVSICINVNWINDIACYFGYFLAIYLVTFIALISGFNYVFHFVSLLFEKKTKKQCVKKEQDVTILIPVYNAKETIKETLESIQKQKYCGDIFVKIIDDGSTDGTLALLKSMELDSNTTIIEATHQGKSSALNKALQTVKTDYTITVDADTVLHPLAVRNIMSQLMNSDEKTAAVAGFHYWLFHLDYYFAY